MYLERERTEDDEEIKFGGKADNRECLACTIAYVDYQARKCGRVQGRGVQWGEAYLTCPDDALWPTGKNISYYNQRIYLNNKLREYMSSNAEHASVSRIWVSMFVSRARAR